MRNSVPLLYSAAVTIFLSSLIPATAVRSSAQGSPSCTAIEHAASFGWVTSAGWNASLQELLMWSASRDQLFILTTQGSVLTQVGDLEKFSGRAVVTGDNGKLGVLSGVKDLYLLDANYARQKVGPPQTLWLHDPQLGEKKKLRAEIKAIFAWVPLGKGHLIFADIYIYPDPNPRLEQTAFLYFETSIEPEVGYGLIVKRFSDPATVPDIYFRSLVKYLTASESVGYILLFEAQPSVVRINVEGGLQRATLSSFPVPYPFSLSSVLLTDSEARLPGRARATLVYKRIQKSRLPVAIQAYDNRLFLLGKDPLGPNGTHWELLELNPRFGHILKDSNLSFSQAAHLTLLPGDRWAILQRSPIQVVGDQQVPYALIERIDLTSEKLSLLAPCDQ